MTSTTYDDVLLDLLCTALDMFEYVSIYIEVDEERYNELLSVAMRLGLK